MDQISNQTNTNGVKKRRGRTITQGENLNMNQVDSTDARLNTHEAVCAERYAGLEDKMTQIDKRFDKVEEDIKEIRSEASQGFKEIKALIERRQGGSHQAIITAAGTIIVALIGFLGYLLTHIR
jgi:septal ring factor EnvC (AmiA/AmiB activator)